MLHAKWIVICLRPIVAQGTNLISLVDCIDGINLQQTAQDASSPPFPVAFPTPISVVVNWSRDEEDPSQYQARITTFTATGEKDFSQEFGIEFDSSNLRPLTHRSIINFPGINVHGFGKLTYVIEANIGGEWVEMGRQFLRIEGEFSNVEKAPS